MQILARITENKKAWAISTACGLLTVFSLPPLLCWGMDTTHSIHMVVLLTLLALGGAWLLSCRDRRLVRFSLCFGAVFALCQLVGWRLDAAGTVGGGLAPLWLLCAVVGCTPAAGFCFGAFVRLVEFFTPKERKSGVSPQKVFWLSFGLILLCWLPVYLAYYPGMFNFDSAGEASQFLSGTYDGAFPPFHTLLLAGFYFLGQGMGSINTGIALYTAVQCCALAASMAYAACYLRRLGSPGLFIGKTVLLFALLPFHPLLAMSTTKDIFFNAALLTLLIRLHMGWQRPELWKAKAQWVWVVLLIAAIGLLRQNGIAGIVLLLVVGFFLLGRGESRKRFAAMLLVGLVLFAGVNTGLKQLLNPSRTGIREMLSLPLSQVARVYTQAQEAGEVLPEEEEILAFIPDAHRYQPHLADNIKRHTTVGVVNMPQFAALWGKLGARYPAVYADAFAYLTKGYWYLDDQTHLEIYAERGAHGYMETANQDGYGVTRQSLWPWLQDELDRLFVDNEYRSIPLLSAVVEPAFWCWLLWAVMWMALYRRNKGAVFCSVMLAGLYATLLLGACAYIRYAYPMALCALPLLGICMAEGNPALPGEK